MKITIVTSHPIQYQVPLFRELAQRPGIKIEVLFLRIPDERRQGEGFDTPFRWDIPMLDGYTWKQCADTRAELSRFKPDRVLLMGWHDRGLLRALRTARDRRLPCIVRGESNGLRPRGALKRLAHRLFLRRFSAYAAIGEANRDFYLSSGVEPRRIFRSPYFVDNARFLRQIEEHRSQRVVLRVSWGIPQKAYCFLFAGKFEAKKRPLDLVLAATAALKDAQRPIHVLFAGAGPLLDPIRRSCAASGLPTSFTGFLNQSQITRAYAAADCLVLPSDAGETWGLVVNEAMVCGLPAIVSDQVGCGPDLVRPGRTGWTYPCGRIDALTGCLRQAAGDPENTDHLGRAARQRVLTHYTVEAAADGILAAAAAVL